jgi:hypothetical protein
MQDPSRGPQASHEDAYDRAVLIAQEADPLRFAMPITGDIVVTLRDHAYSWPRPANAGAHRLAWWIGKGGSASAGDAEAAIADIARVTDYHPSMIDRMLSGDLTPVGSIAARIAVETGGRVLPTDWDLPADGGWLDVPTPRAAP